MSDTNSPNTLQAPYVNVLYFAKVRESIGVGQETVALETPCDAEAFIAQLRTRSANHAAALQVSFGLRIAINQRVSDLEHGRIAPGDEVAIFPPVTGG